MTWRLGLVAGEPSGDLIAARVLAGVQRADAEVRAEGIGGPQLAQQGLTLWHPMQALTVFGYLDALKQVPTLVRTYLNVKRRWLEQPPSVFLGIDAPDFNLRLEHSLKQAGIPTVHLVSPSIWAWRYERINHIRESVSHMLVMFPFEEALYQKEKIPVTFVGHPLADAIAQEPDRAAARKRLGLDTEARVLALLPGSRASEIKWIAPIFLQTVQRLQKRDPQLHVLVPMVNAARLAEFKAILQRHPVENLHILSTKPSRAFAGFVPPNTPADQQGVSIGQADQQSVSIGQADTPLARPVAWDALEACDVALVASGTATLETALFKRPMVISYAVSPWVRRIMAWKSGQQRPYVPWVGLPNVLLNDSVVPELIQEDATPEKLAQAVYEKFMDERKAREIEVRFQELHQSLRCDTASRATQVILELAHQSRSAVSGVSRTDRPSHESHGSGQAMSRAAQPSLFVSVDPTALYCAGVDEAGRGPLAGDVYAAAVILDPAQPVEGLADSKVLTEKRREALAPLIQQRALAWCVAWATVQEIDQLNILQATLLAMQRAVQGLKIAPELAWVDGNQPPRLACRVQTVVKGDALVPAISAASILAKTARDADLLRLHSQHPEYGFNLHKGYGTALHMARLKEFGPCPAHRRSFAPVRRLLEVS